MAISFATILLLSGCASIAGRGMDDFKDGIYPGVRCNTATLNSVWTEADPEDSGGRLFWTPVLLVDLPFSIVADTICLPYDLLKEIETEP